MTITYTNRRGKVYYLHSKPTKKGNIRYFFSTKTDGRLQDRIPDGYEVYDNANAQVFLRKKQPQIITDEELDIVRRVLRKHAPEEWRYKAEIKKDAIVVHSACQDYDRIEETMPFGGRLSAEFKRQHATYMPIMRFTLVDRDDRRFYPERMCFRGEDHWIGVGDSGPLAWMASKYIKHLGKESFYELY